MVDSFSLQLTQSSARLQDHIGHYLSQQLQKCGYIDVNASILSFLGALDCGVNYGSEIARNLEVSRQMVAKTVKELCKLGYLMQQPGEGKQKKILFTPKGEQLMSDARQLLADLDDVLCEQVPDTKALLEQLQQIQQRLEQISTDESDR